MKTLIYIILIIIPTAIYMDALSKLKQEKNTKCQVDSLQRLYTELERRVTELENFLREDMEYTNGSASSDDEDYTPLKRQKTQRNIEVLDFKPAWDNNGYPNNSKK
nr:MAG: hypothetical protein [Cressdnaviricota sp.]